MNGLVRRFLAMLLVCAALALPSSSAAAATSRQVSVTAHGMRLTLAVASRTYPRNALVPVRVSLRNVSSRAIQSSPMVVGFCSRVDFLVDVLDRQGQPLSPLPPPPGPLPPCPAPLPYTLHPGQTVSHTVYAVLLVNRLRAIANVNTVAGTSGYRGAEISTPPLALRLRSAAAPPVAIQAVNGHTVAAVSRPSGAKGPLRYEQWADCGTSMVRALTWTRAAGNTVDAGCLNPRQWHLVAGWAGHRVAILNVTSPTPPATLVLTPPFSATPYTAHVGDVIEVKVLLLGPGVDKATADPAYLRLLSSSAAGGEPVRYDWRWQAIAPGDTTIVISRQSPAGQQYMIRLHITR